MRRPSQTPAPGQVLLVDHDPDVLRSTALLIEAMGYDVVTLETAADVLDTIQRLRPGLVLQETQMPDVNIAGLMAAIRSDPEIATTRVVFYSAVLDLPATARRHAAWAYLGKPFAVEELSHILERALGPPPGKAAFSLSKDVEKEIRIAFREYRNALGAINNYVMLLEKANHLPGEARESVERIKDLILMLEARTSRLRAYILCLVGPDPVVHGGARDDRPPPGGRGRAQPSAEPRASRRAEAGVPSGRP